MCYFFRKRAREKGGVCLCVCVWGGGGVYHIQRLTKLLFSQDLCKKKQRRLPVDNSVPCFNILDQILLLFLFLIYAEKFRLNVGVPLFDKVKQTYLKTS